MRRDLLIAAGPGEWRAGLVEADTTVELMVERGDSVSAGALYLGRVLRLLPALKAALVEIGDLRPAFLPLSDTLPRRRQLVEGERLIVQIQREPQGEKPARLSMRLALRDRSVALNPGIPGLRGAETIPAAIRDEIIAHWDLGTNGATLRDAVAAAADPAASLAELASLRQRWSAIEAEQVGLDPPARLGEPPGLAERLAAGLGCRPDLVLIDSHGAIPALRAAFPDSEIAYREQALWPIDLDAEIDTALAGDVPLGGGGRLRLDAAPGAVLIDVDSGGGEPGGADRAPLGVNRLAAIEIARQLRLRSLGGGIVIDFIGMEGQRPRDEIRACMERALAGDPAKPQILGWTRLGHLELVRPRSRRPIAEILLDPVQRAEPRKSTATTALQVLRAVARAAQASPGRLKRLAVSPAVAAALYTRQAAARQSLERQLGAPLLIQPDPSLSRDQFEIGR